MDRAEINRPLLAFIALGTAVLLTIPQDYAVIPRSPLYWAIWTPALLSLFATREIVRYLLNEGIALTVFGLLSSAWFLVSGDYRIIVQTLPLIWMTAWIASAKGKIPVDWIIRGFWALVALSVVMFHTGDNMWGYLPGQTVEQRWRVSLFPRISDTFTFLLPVALILTRDKVTRRAHWLTLWGVVYFLVLSQGRSGILALALYLIIRWLLKGVRTKRRLLMAIPIAACVGILGGMALAAPVMYAFQELPGASFFLRGQTGLSLDEIRAQFYRPWLWSQHFSVFLDNPLGAGNLNFAGIIGDDIAGQASGGTESFPTRLLASYGIFSLLFFSVFWYRLALRANRFDWWACAAYAAIIFMMMTYGSAFHPSSPINALCLLILFHGSEGFLATKKVRVRRRLRELRKAEPQGA